MAEEFDVFLSHNSRDKAVVEEIGQLLRERRLSVWLDKWELRPGQRWQKGLADGVEKSLGVAVFIGENGLGPWEEPEMEAFLDRATRDQDLPVIPVLLPGAPQDVELPLFLRRYTWVDLRDGVSDSGLEQLIWGITGQRPEAGSKKSTLQNLPFPSLGPGFKGREDLLQQLAQDFESQGTAALTQPQTLSGLGGIGKTRLAVEYAWRNLGRYRAVFFVRAENPSELSRGLAQLAGEDRLDLGLEGAPEEQAVRAVLGWLQRNSEWLLILDNVDDEKAQQAVRGLLTFQTGHVLITSRLSVWPGGIAERSVETLEPEDAVQLLLDQSSAGRRATEEDLAAAAQVAELLGGLPLALEQAAAYIAARGLSFAEYLADWESRREQVLDWYEEAATEYPFSVTMTWSHSFERLSEDVRTLLRVLAHLAPEPVPSGLVDACEENLVADARGGLAELRRYSLVTWQDGGVVVHPIVQAVVRGRISEGERREWVERVVGLVTAFAPSKPSDVRTWPVWDPLRPHAVRVVELAERYDVAAAALALMSQLGLLLQTKSLLSEAEPLMRRALELGEASYGSDHPVVAIRLNNLALLLQERNRMDKAEPLMRRALEIDEASYGPDHPDVAIDLNNLAQLLHSTNRLAEAEPLMRRVVQILDDSLGSDHPQVVVALNNLAQLLQATNRMDEAEPLMRRALEIDEASHGPDHPEVAIRLNNLATLLQATNRLAEAEPLKRRAVRIFDDSLGSEHPRVAVALNNLAQLLQATDRLDEAEPLMRRALEIDEASYGPDHPEVARDLNNLARLLQATERAAEGEPLMRRSLLILLDFTQRHGHTHPHLQTSFGNYYVFLTDLGKSPEEIQAELAAVLQESGLEQWPWEGEEAEEEESESVD